MSTQVYAKVSFEGRLRQFSINRVAAGYDWKSFEDEIRRLHEIPPTTRIVVTYKDQDNDTISLNTDAELRDAAFEARQGKSAGDRVVIRFDVRDRDADPAGFVVVNEQEQSALPEPAQPSVQQSAQNEPVYPSVPIVAESPSVDDGQKVAAEHPVDTSVDKGKAPASATATSASSSNPSVKDGEPRPESTSSPENNGSSSSSSNNQDNEAPQNPFEAFTENIKPLLDQIQANIDAHPEFVQSMSNLISQIGVQAQAHIDPILRNVHEQVRQGMHGRCPHRQTPFGFGFPFGSRFPPSQEGGFPFSAAPSAPRTPTADELKSKVEILNGMGFWNNSRIEELLKRYDGNVERVVEVLLRE
ncbi:uncharacterized protein SPPG_04415 [Spizellomyces punctatus DAOM BR117]|uniref:PB1 domain-containing protein n=1 Tax=Spizellomyces punctatus (strain DAOM BR117) TaxID=645134 RepID=A0A0L0HH17_SPIPD|nr:uncharacterized protein SPPG_04415 [Spizellomyces punctatus DAOM BR117]KND00074.1 hypothetical protein SPPG_04415 [Spizellomyces punctatus DAOM BR117]|eukprot:XP_016608113.1 hypothetical protein SPPG_04415 [Spizellomyces punctatus DAOM BR117]